MSRSTADRPGEATIPSELPLLPLRDLVVYPQIIAPLSVARDISIQAVDHALSENRMIFLVVWIFHASEGRITGLLRPPKARWVCGHCAHSSSSAQRGLR